MRFFLPFLLCLTSAMADDPDPAWPPTTAPDGTVAVFKDPEHGGIESLRFQDNHQIIPLAGEAMSWPGIYYFSPDSHWLLRIQKTGSGQSEAILYQIETNRRITQVIAFDQQLWDASDQVARMKKKNLYHTGIDDHPLWSGDQLAVILQGSSASASGDGISVKVIYDLKKNTFTATPLEGTK